MDQKSQEYFDKIIAKNPEELNETEIAFLRARSSYLKKIQLEEYADVLAEKPSEAPLNELTRKELETKATELGIQTPEDKKLFPKNADLVTAIENQTL